MNAVVLCESRLIQVHVLVEKFRGLLLNVLVDLEAKLKVSSGKLLFLVKYGPDRDPVYDCVSSIGAASECPLNGVSCVAVVVPFPKKNKLTWKIYLPGLM